MQKSKSHECHKFIDIFAMRADRMRLGVMEYWREHQNLGPSFFYHLLKLEQRI